ncbi:MAG: ABC transporter ATP-binding protein [Gammaproteobacteria bacterium]|nr:ABC transporter ATP-binding protein [Gammaproteobacteria bacterium]MCP5201074.1 ABC transporter ATP-binding protein [Gammaproteobacteria bacterium]
MIELRGITRRFVLGDSVVKAVDGIDLDIGPGEYLSIMGPSGSGKSSLLNLVALLDRPSSGSYRFEGRDVTALDDDELAALRRDSIGFIFQFFHLVPRLTAAANVELPLTLAGVAPAERRERVATMLAAMDLADRAHHRPAELSGGQRQRVAIARAMIAEPRLLLADEPTGNLDSHSGAQVVELLEGLQQDRGITLIVVTHDAAIGRRAQRRLRLVDGRVESDERG